METVLQIGLSNALVASTLALVAVLVGYFYRRPALVHGLWLLVLLKLLTPPLVPIPITWPAAAPVPLVTQVLVAPSTDSTLPAVVIAESVADSGEAPADFVAIDLPSEQTAGEPIAPAEDMAPAAPFPWQALVAIVWLAGSAGWFLLAGWRVWRFRRLLRLAVPAPDSLRELIGRLAHKMKLRAYPTVLLVPGRLPPMLWAAGGKPLLLVPGELLAQLTLEQQRTLLVHELAHLRRGDHWVRGLEFLVMGLYWWHPVVWYARRELREAEEQCCDAWVVSLLPGASKTYATALLETLDFLSDARSGPPLLASAIGHVSDLKRRLTMIMSASTPRSLSWRGTLLVLSLGLLALPLLPTLVHAQTQEIQQDVEKLLAQLRVEVSKNEDVAKAQAELAKAQAELAKTQQDVKIKQEQIKALEARLAAMKGGRKTEEAKPGVMILQLDNGQIMKWLVPDNKKEAPKAGSGNIVLRFGDDNKNPNEIVLRKVGDKWEVVQPKAPAGPLPMTPGTTAKPGEPKGIEFELKLSDGKFEIAPNKGATPPKPPMNPKGIQVVPRPVPEGRKMPENRLDSLERQLQQIMKELETLRKEMKQPKANGAAAPGLELDLSDLLKNLKIEVESQKKQ